MVAGAGLLAELIVYGAGGLVMVALFMYKAEALFVIGVGAVLMVGMAAAVLLSFPLRYLGALIGLGLHGIALSFLAGTALNETVRLQSTFDPSKPLVPHDLLVTCATLLFLGFMIWKLPELLASLGGVAAFSPAGGFAAGMAMQSLLSQVLPKGGAPIPAGPREPSEPDEPEPGEPEPGEIELVPDAAEGTGGAAAAAEGAAGGAAAAAEGAEAAEAAAALLVL
jgi:hypothetical protein